MMTQVRLRLAILLIVGSLVVGNSYPVNGKTSPEGSIVRLKHACSGADEVDRAVERLVLRYRQLTQELQADSPGRPAAVAELQGLANPRIVRRYARRLLQPDPANQNHRETLALLNALEEYGIPAAVAILAATRKGYLGGVKVEDRHVRELSKAIQAHPERWEWLLPMTNADEEWARRWAIRNGRHAMEYPPVIDHWFKIALDLERPTADRRNALVALRGATQLSRLQVESLIPMLVAVETGLQGDTLITLADHYQSSRSLLAARLAEDDPGLRVAELNCLARMGHRAADVSHLVLPQLAADSRDVRIAAAYCYLRCSRKTEPIIDLLKRELTATPGDDLYRLITLLAEDAAPVAPIVAEHLQSSRREKSYNIQILRALASTGADYLSLYDECLLDPPARWSAAAAVARTNLAQSAGPAARILAERISTQLDRAVEDPDLTRREIIPLLFGLRRMGPHAIDAAPVIEQIIPALQDQGYPLRAYAFSSLAAMGRDSIPVLERLANNPQVIDPVKRQAVRELDRLKQLRDDQ